MCGLVLTFKISLSRIVPRRVLAQYRLALVQASSTESIQIGGWTAGRVDERLIIDSTTIIRKITE